MKKHQLSKHQLKKLIREVIREADEISAEPDEKEPSTKPGEPLKHSAEFEKHQEENVIKLTLRGLKPGKAYKEMMAAMAWEAKKKDLEVIHAEIDKAGKPVVTMDSGELQSKAKEEPEEEEPGAESPEDRLARIRQGEREPEWKAATQKDLEDARKKEKLKAAKIAAGTYDPNDTSLWTDKDWDAWDKANPPSKSKARVNVGTLKHQ
jgi:hypothetical protein